MYTHVSKFHICGKQKCLPTSIEPLYLSNTCFPAVGTGRLQHQFHKGSIRICLNHHICSYPCCLWIVFIRCLFLPLFSILHNIRLILMAVWSLLFVCLFCFGNVLLPSCCLSITPENQQILDKPVGCLGFPGDFTREGGSSIWKILLKYLRVFICIFVCCFS